MQLHALREATECQSQFGGTYSYGADAGFIVTEAQLQRFKLRHPLQVTEGVRTVTRKDAKCKRGGKKGPNGPDDLTHTIQFPARLSGVTDWGGDMHDQLFHPEPMEVLVPEAKAYDQAKSPSQGQPAKYREWGVAMDYVWRGMITSSHDGQVRTDGYRGESLPREGEENARGN